MNETMSFIVRNMRPTKDKDAAFLPRKVDSRYSKRSESMVDNQK